MQKTHVRPWYLAIVLAVTTAGLMLVIAPRLGLGSQQQAVVQAAQQGAEMHNMRLVGFHDLQGRGSYQPVVQRQGERWIAYLGSHGGVRYNSVSGQDERNGTSIVDVTNPAEPKYLAHIPGHEGTRPGDERAGAQMVRVCNGSDLPRADDDKVYLLRTLGNIAHEIWDVTEPAEPSLVTVVVSDLVGTHKNWWECDTGIAYLVSGDPQWRIRRMTKIYDLSDPSDPVFVRDFGLDGHQPGSTGDIPIDLHGLVSTGAEGNRVYFGYGTTRNGVAQIVDREKLLNGPAEPTVENLAYPQIARIDLPPSSGAHNVFPLLGLEPEEFAKQRPVSPSADTGPMPRDYLVVVGESLAEDCREWRQMVRFFDITLESTPVGVSTWTVPEASGNFCARGGRFGSHSTHESFSSIYYGRVLFVTFFNAGLRALDVRNPVKPQEIAYYIPASTETTAPSCVGEGADERCKVVIQTNNVDVDDRGFIYITDRLGTGMHILELTGEARSVANFSGSE